MIVVNIVNKIQINTNKYNIFPQSAVTLTDFWLCEFDLTDEVSNHLKQKKCQHIVNVCFSCFETLLIRKPCNSFSSGEN